MGQAAERVKMTREAYLELERASAERHEYADGEVFALSGGSREHSLLGQNLARELGNALAGRPCEVHGADLKVKVAESNRYHYPDVFVVSGEPVLEGDARDVVLDPKLIAEVLSDSTEAYDRGDKWAGYRSLASLTDYVLVSQKTELIEHYRRLPDGSWNYAVVGRGQTLALASLGCTLAVDAVYRRVFDLG